MTAAETAHLVFSTLHTIDASKTVEPGNLRVQLTDLQQNDIRSLIVR